MKRFVLYLSIFMCMSLMHQNSYASRVGACYEKVAANAKHIFFSIESGKALLKDINRLNKTEQALDLERKLLLLEKKNNELLASKVKKCGEALHDSKKALKDATGLIDSMKKQLQKAWSDVLLLRGQVQKLKRQRATFFLVGFGIGAIVAGGVAIAINFVAQNDGQLRAGLIGAGAGGILVGGTLIGVAFLR